MICQVRSSRDATVPWPSTSDAPVPSVTAIWESWSPNAGDQWTVPEMWLSAGVGIDSAEDYGEATHPTFHRR